MEQVAAPAPPRLRSLDALRGFDMFWIIGGDWLISSIAKVAKSGAFDAVSAQFSDHVEWEGFRYYDMIFPLFLFIIGVTLPFSLGRRLEQGASRKELVAKVLRRTLVLILLGLIYNGMLRFDGWDHLRLFGVLQRQALGYCVAALLMLYTRPKTQAIIGVAILFGYWALMALAPVPGCARGSYTPDCNFANYIDRLILLPHQMYETYGDPEGPLSTIPAVVTALLGLFAGRWLRSDRDGAKKAMWLAVAGVVLVLLGTAWWPVFPVIKKIWTSSYVLFAGGMSALLLAGFYWVVDVKGWWKWSFPLIVIGMNPITIYLLSEVVDFGAMAKYFVEGASKHAPLYQDIILAASALTLKWLLLWFLYTRKVFLKV